MATENITINCLSKQFEHFEIPGIDKNNQSVNFPNCNLAVSISPPTLPISVTFKLDTIYDDGPPRGVAITTIHIGSHILEYIQCTGLISANGNIKCGCQNYDRFIHKTLTVNPVTEGPSPEGLTSKIITIKNDKDIYTLYLPIYTDICNTTHRNYEYMLLNFERPLRQSIVTPISIMLKMKSCSSSIDILGQTLFDGSDVGQMIFNVKYDNITTIYNKSCPKMVSVFIGDSEYLITKVNDLWLKLNISIELPEFYEQIIRYGMLRYILSKLLYGNFNINYLLRKYYEKFLIDLNNSKFCNFNSFFTTLPYSQFYKYFK